MADDWKPGDLALCVNAKPDRRDPRAYLLTVGRIYVVGAVGARTVDRELALAFHELRSNQRQGWAFTIRRFRKIRPLTDEERGQFKRELNPPARENV